MKSNFRTTVVVFGFAIMLSRQLATAAEPKTSDLDALVSRHQWGSLRDALAGHDHAPFYQGAVAAAFNDADQAQRLFQVVIAAAPMSELAYQAHSILAGMYLRLGQYRLALGQADAMLAIKPDNVSDREGRALLVALSQAPDQTVRRRAPSHIQGVSKDGGNPALPMMLNGHPVNYVIDGNANISSISESDAQRAGLKFHELPAGATKISGVTGMEISYRVAVAETVIIGNIELANVAFLVFPDDQQPWVEMPPGARGAVGVSVLVALRTCRWNQDDSVEAGFPGKAQNLRDANLWFDGPNIITDVQFHESRISMLFDTGSEATDFWPPFAAEFGRVVDESGQNDSKKLSGIGHDLVMDTKTLSDVTLKVGGYITVLRSAHILLKPTVRGSTWFFGRLGFDLLHQARHATLDFESMTLKLE